MEGCLDDILFLEMATEMYQEAEMVDYSYLDDILGLNENTEVGIYD